MLRKRPTSNTRYAIRYCDGFKRIATIERMISNPRYAVQDSSALFSVARSVDTIYRHDSVYVREVMRGDTVYLTRTEWRDRWRTRLVHDTIRDTQYITQTIDHPPEKYVPKFYKWCTGALWAVLGVLVVLIVLKVRR